MSELSIRVVKALNNNSMVILPTVRELMADAWDEGALWALDACGYESDWLDPGHMNYPEDPNRVTANPYRVAAPEGDGGNE